MKQRLDIEIVKRGLATTRSQAGNLIKLGDVLVDGSIVTKSGFFVSDSSNITIKSKERYVSRAGLKLASVAKLLRLDFRDKLVLDVGSSTGGFTDYALQHGAKKVFAVDVGSDQLHPSLRSDVRIELHEKTDIRDIAIHSTLGSSERSPMREGRPGVLLEAVLDIIVIDVSFISLREILPHIARHLSNKNTQIVAMVKPQFEAGKHQVNKGVIKNDSVRRKILVDFEGWSKQYFIIQDKRDSEVAGTKGNRERFYLLKRLK